MLFNTAGGLFLLTILEYIARLASQLAADGLECGEAYGLCFSGLQDGEIGRSEFDSLSEFAERHFSFCHLHIQVYYNSSHGVRW